MYFYRFLNSVAFLSTKINVYKNNYKIRLKLSTEKKTVPTLIKVVLMLLMSFKILVSTSIILI